MFLILFKIKMIRKAFYKTMISLRVPSMWTIVKNNLIHLSLQEINALGGNERFEIIEFYLSYNVFQARLSLSNRFVDEITIWVSSYPAYENEKLVSLSYEVDLYVIKNYKSKKQDSILYRTTLEITSFELLQETLNSLMLNALFDQSLYLNSNQFELLLENIDKSTIKEEVN